MVLRRRSSSVGVAVRGFKRGFMLVALAAAPLGFVAPRNLQRRELCLRKPRPTNCLTSSFVVMGCGASAKVSPSTTNEKWTDLMGASSMNPGKHFDAPDGVAMPTNIHDHLRHLRKMNRFRKVVEKKPTFFAQQVENKRQRDFDVEDNVKDVDVLKAAHGSATRAVLMLKTKAQSLEAPPPPSGHPPMLRRPVRRLPPRRRAPSTLETNDSTEV
eukprot:s1267_g44.t1